MKKSENTLAVAVNTITILCGLVYIAMQLYYGITWQIPWYKYVFNIVVLLLIYLALTLLEHNPEKINGLSARICRGKIRKLSVWMVRIIRLILAAGLLVPGAADCLGLELKGFYSAVIILLIIGTAIVFECMILNELHKS